MSIHELSEKLVSAVIANDLDAAKACLKRGAPPNIYINLPDSPHDNSSPLMIAAQQGNIRMTELLLLYDADKDWMNKYGATALLYATEKGHIGATEALLAAGADPNLSKNWGGTALHWAARSGKKPLCMLLLRYGARADIKNSRNQTPSESAQSEGHTQLSVYLEHAENRWSKTTGKEKEMTHRTLPTQDTGITYIFNFSAMTLSKITHNFETGHTAQKDMHFSAPEAEKDIIVTAAEKFKQAGCTLDEHAFRRALHTVMPFSHVPRYRRHINRRTPKN
ncbi:MAG: hypothetical protein EA357_02985 [Micavibrio sp.]|nr:MAG: hypothetical protein EA357_02985 [Micavibrio sp.]